MLGIIGVATCRALFNDSRTGSALARPRGSQQDAALPSDLFMDYIRSS